MHALILLSLLRPFVALRPERDLDLRSEGTAIAVQRLLTAADSHFTQSSERAEAENYHLSRGLQSLGLGLQDRFRIFALRRALVLARKADEGREPDGLGNRLDPRFAVLENGRVHSGFSCKDEDLDAWLHGMKSQRATRKQFLSQGHLHARATLKNYCAILEMVQEKEEKIEVSDADVERLKNSAVAMDADEARLEPLQRGSIHQSAEEKRNWHQADLLRNLRWLGNWNATDMELLKELNLRARIMNQRLTKLVDFVSETLEIDWFTLSAGDKESVGMALKKGMRFLGKFSKSYLMQLGQNTAGFFINCWNAFKIRLRHAERRCEREGEQDSRAAAKRAGLKSQAELSGEAVEQASKKVDEAMDEVIHRAEQGALSEEQAKEKLSVARSTASTLHQHLDEGDLTSIDEAESAIEEVENSVCKTQRISALQRLKEVLRKSKEAMLSGGSLSVPTLAVRGVGMSALGLGGGLEEVVDFRNREIAQFRWGTGFFGPSVAGMGLGGYAGVGWKGYKENWTLQESIVTGLWSSVGLTPSIFGLYAGLSATFATDADNSVAGPWVPEPHGFNTATFGWSAGASITKAVVPMHADVGATYCWYLNSECFDSVTELVKYLWLPTCKDCAGTERKSVSALRAGIHGPSFPIISETAFSLLAILYDRYKREPGYKPECSPNSLSLRKDPKHFTRQLGDLMFANARLLEDLVQRWDIAMRNLAVAEEFNPELERSEEYRSWFQAAKSNFETCTRHGPILSVMKEDTRLMYREMSDKDLHGLCLSYAQHYGLQLDCDAAEPRKRKEERLLRYENLKGGSFSRQDVQTLMREVRSTSTAGKILSHTLSSCDPNSCMDPLEALHVLQKVPPRELLRMCQRRGLQCEHRARSKACRICSTRARKHFTSFCWKCGQETDQWLATKILVALGAGNIGQASASDPFGACDSDADCWLVGTECHGDGQDRHCMCKVGFCYTLVRNVTNFRDDSDFLPLCLAPQDAWREIAEQMKRDFLTYRYTLGQMVGRIKTLPS